MFNQILISTFFIFLCSPFYAQKNINTNNIDIIRDQYGVPHIFTKTDVEAAYGIAWAQCEDNFHLIQDNFATTKGMAGRLMGKNGAALDFMYEVFEIDDFVERRYEQDITPQIEKMLVAYTDALNKYAATHPDEVKSTKLFPITPKKVLGNHILQLLLRHGTLQELGKLLTKGYDYSLMEQAGRGSNAMAFSPNITADEKTYLIGNPHQPVNTMGNFWEVSVHSEEGYEMFGATFSVGGIVLALGTNRHLGWSHTTNYQNSADVYQLEMHPTKKHLYKYDDEWLPLEVKKAKLKVKIGAFVLPVTKKYYRSKYGPTFKKKSGYYSCKANVFYNLKLVEQWYKMGQASNMDEFMEAVNLQGLTGQTTTYADKEENIYHLSSFHHPMRNEDYDWSSILPGNTSATNWNLETIYPISDLPQIKNPECGYVYNCNNTVFKITAPDENLKPEDFPKSFGLLRSNTIRANTFEKLIKNYEKITFEEARKIRENVSVDKAKMSFRNCMNCDDIPMIINKNAQLSEYKKVYDKWDGTFTIDNKQASLMMLTAMYFAEYVKSQMGNVEKDIPEKEIVNAMLKAQKFLMKHYGTLEVELGKIQKAVRYDVELPMYGSTNTLANTHVTPYKKGKVKIVAGDSFIFYAKYGQEGLERLETINAFGNSTKKGHPHSTDQTEMYVNMKTKNVELDVQKLKAMGKGYHPQ